MHSITFYKNKASNKFEIFSEGPTFRRVKMTKQHVAIASTYKELKKNYKSDNTSPTRQLSRFVSSSDFADFGNGNYFACSYETDRISNTGEKQSESVMAFVDENWTVATVRTRVGRRIETRTFQLIIADKMGNYAGEKSTIYNAYMNKEVEIEAESEVNISDVDVLLSKLKALTAENEALKINNDLLSRRNSKLEAVFAKTRKEDKFNEIHADLDALDFEYTDEIQKKAIEEASVITPVESESVVVEPIIEEENVYQDTPAIQISCINKLIQTQTKGINMKIIVSHIRTEASFEIKVDDFVTTVSRLEVMTDKDYHFKIAQKIAEHFAITESISVLANKIKEEISKH